MQKKELIVLDATLVSVLECSVFRARLENGHEFVAVAKTKRAMAGPYQVGQQVRVEFSPFDLSTGYVMETPGHPGRHSNEGTEFGQTDL